MFDIHLCLLFFGLAVGPALGQVRFLTWNTNGARWEAVVNYLNHAEVLAIQEAGTLQPQILAESGQRPHPFDSIVRENANIQIAHVNLVTGQITETQYNGGVTLYKIVVQRKTYFMYYYERIVDDPNMQALNRDTRKQNMAIISTVRAQKVYVFAPHSRNPNRVDVNRPILGISIPGYMVFSVHTDPLASNEIDITIEIIYTYMKNYCRLERWILMGDFNAQPNEIRVPSASDGCYLQLVYPTQPTKPQRGRIIDYAICGGPISWNTHIQAVTEPNLLGSDHFPVIIQSVNSM